MKSPEVFCDDPEQMIQAIDLKIQNLAASRRKAKSRTAIRIYSLVCIVFMIAAVLFALQLFTSHMQTHSGRINESEKLEPGFKDR